MTLSLSKMLACKRDQLLGQRNSNSRLFSGICPSLSQSFSFSPLDTRGGREGRNIFIGDKGDVDQGGYRNSRREFARFLQYAFPGTQKRRRQAPSTKPKTVKQTSEIYEVHHGDTRLNSPGVEKRGLAGKSGPAGCIFPCSSLASTQTIPKICISKHPLPVQGLALRVIHSTKGVHKGLGTHSLSYPSKRNKVPSISGRLLDSSEVRSRAVHSAAAGSQNTSKCRFPVKLEQVQTQSVSGHSVSRDANKIRYGKSTTSKGESRGHDKMCTDVSSSSTPSSQNVSSITRPDGSLFAGGATGAYENATYPNVFSFQMEASGTRIEPQVHSPSVIDSVLGLLEGGIKPYSGGSSPVQHPPVCSDHRCVQYRLGRSLDGLESPGILGKESGKVAHQLSGNAGSPLDSENVRSIPQGQKDQSENRQYCGSPIYQQGGGYRLIHSVCPSSETTSMVCPEQDLSDSRTCAGCGEYAGRHSVSQNSLANGVVSRQNGGTNPIQTFGRTTLRSVRHS